MYQQYARDVLTRVSTLTGVAYKWVPHTRQGPTG
jgi:hypothetical protein